MHRCSVSRVGLSKSGRTLVRRPGEVRRGSNARSQIGRVCGKESANAQHLFRGLINHFYGKLYTLAIKIKLHERTYRSHRPRVLIPSNAHRIDPRCCLLHSVFVPVPSREPPRERSLPPPVLFLFLFLPPRPTRRKTLRDWIKIAGAISRTHDIGENATEALIMADTRRAVAATTFYPLTQDSHYTNVPPIIGPRSAALLSPPSSPLRTAFLNHLNQNHANRRGNQIPRPRRGDTAKISVKRSAISLYPPVISLRVVQIFQNLPRSHSPAAFSTGHVRLRSERFISRAIISFIRTRNVSSPPLPLPSPLSPPPPDTTRSFLRGMEDRNGPSKSLTGYFAK